LNTSSPPQGTPREPGEQISDVPRPLALQSPVRCSQVATASRFKRRSTAAARASDTIRRRPQELWLQRSRQPESRTARESNDHRHAHGQIQPHAAVTSSRRTLDHTAASSILIESSAYIRALFRWGTPSPCIILRRNVTRKRTASIAVEAFFYCALALAVIIQAPAIERIGKRLPRFVQRIVLTAVRPIALFAEGVNACRHIRRLEMSEPRRCVANRRSAPSHVLCEGLTFHLRLNRVHRAYSPLAEVITRPARWRVPPVRS
jgi:hypothetical protein